jgi:hypothetical protein
LAEEKRFQEEATEHQRLAEEKHRQEEAERLNAEQDVERMVAARIRAERIGLVEGIRAKRQAEQPETDQAAEQARADRKRATVKAIIVIAGIIVTLLCLFFVMQAKKATSSAAGPPLVSEPALAMCAPQLLFHGANWA